MRPIALAIVLIAALSSTSALGAHRASDEAQQIAQIETLTEQIRHLHHTHAVKVVLPSNAAFDATFKTLEVRNNPESEIEISRRESVLLGLLKKTDNLKKILLSGLTSQVEGFYDYQAKILYVRNTNGVALGLNRWAIAHEYNHALQDQNFDLQKILPDQTPLAYRNSDKVAAHRALTEGDSVNVQTIFIYKTYSPQDLAALVKQQSQPAGGPALPKAIQREFYFPYTDGVNFVNTIYKAGGMSGVTAAYHRLPQSTYEIMHPAAYLKGWKPVPVSLHSVQGFAEWKQVDDDVMGAFGYNLMLWQFLGTNRANAITSSYSGDRYVFLENGNQDAMLFKSVWTTPKAASTARSAFLAGLKARYKHVSVLGGSAMTVTEKDGGVYLQVTGNALTVAFAPTPALADQLGSAPTT
jgi:hypothetical protein